MSKQPNEVTEEFLSAVLTALESCENKSRLARETGISRQTLNRLLADTNPDRATFKVVYTLGQHFYNNGNADFNNFFQPTP